jgi:hypothetical protein
MRWPGPRAVTASLPRRDVRDIHGMVLVGASFPDAKAQVAAEVTCEPRMLLKPSAQAPSRPEPGRTGLEVEGRWFDLALAIHSHLTRRYKFGIVRVVSGGSGWNQRRSGRKYEGWTTDGCSQSP